MSQVICYCFECRSVKLLKLCHKLLHFDCFFVFCFLTIESSFCIEFCRSWMISFPSPVISFHWGIVTCLRECPCQLSILVFSGYIQKYILYSIKPNTFKIKNPHKKVTISCFLIIFYYTFFNVWPYQCRTSFWPPTLVYISVGSYKKLIVLY